MKQTAILKEEYENSKFLYLTLNMKNVNDMNDLCNAQDVIFLCEIFKNRFELMYNTFGFNPEKCNSASTLRGCIERDLSKVIIALANRNAIEDIFEKKKTVTGGFSCGNTIYYVLILKF